MDRHYIFGMGVKRREQRMLEVARFMLAKSCPCLVELCAHQMEVEIMPDLAKAALDFFDQHRDEYLSDLKDLIRIPSISFPGYDAGPIQKSAEAVASLLKKAGLKDVQILKTAGHPSVLGQWRGDEAAPTILLYSHHDVQPVGREEMWQSPPFEPVDRGGRLYGRGASDDKGGILIHVAAVSSYLNSNGRLPVNVKVLIEGEEETGSNNLDSLLERYRELLSADAVVISDSENFDSGLPSLTVSLRGIVTVNVLVRSLRSSVHSGTWGGPLPDPVMALSKMLASLVDQDGRLAIPGLLEKVRRLSPKEKALFEGLPYQEGLFRKQAGLLEGVSIIGGDGLVYEKMWRRPSIAINAIEASSRRQAANIINDTAWARLGIRIVPDMDPVETLELLKTHLLKNAPWGVQVEITPESPSHWWTADPDSPAIEAAIHALEQGYGRRPAVVGAGGSVPFVRTITEMLGGIPALLLGVGDPYSAAHSENESLLLSDWEKACRSLIHLFSELRLRLTK